MRHAWSHGVGENEISAAVELVGQDGRPIRYWQHDVSGGQHVISAIGQAARTANYEVRAGEFQTREAGRHRYCHPNGTVHGQLIVPSQPGRDGRQSDAGKSAGVPARAEKLEPVTSGERIWANLNHSQRAAISQGTVHLHLIVGEDRAGLADFHERRALEDGRIAQDQLARGGPGRECAAGLSREDATDRAVTDEESVAADGQSIGERVRAVTHKIQRGQVCAVPDKESLCIIHS